MNHYFVFCCIFTWIQLENFVCHLKRNISSKYFEDAREDKIFDRQLASRNNLKLLESSKHTLRNVLNSLFYFEATENQAKTRFL